MSAPGRRINCHGDHTVSNFWKCALPAYRRTVRSIEKGKLADLILVEGNPLTDIKIMRNVKRVMLNGSGLVSSWRSGIVWNLSVLVLRAEGLHTSGLLCYKMEYTTVKLLHVVAVIIFLEISLQAYSGCTLRKKPWPPDNISYYQGVIKKRPPLYLTRVIWSLRLVYGRYPGRIPISVLDGSCGPYFIFDFRNSFRCKGSSLAKMLPN